jgi:hypothetical protein
MASLSLTIPWMSRKAIWNENTRNHMSDYGYGIQKDTPKQHSQRFNWLPKCRFADLNKDLLAMTYSPRGACPKYHRRWQA